MFDFSVVDEKNQVTKIRRHILMYDQTSQAARLGEYQFAEGQANNHYHLDNETFWSSDSRVSDVNLGLHLPNLLPTTNEEERWYSGVNPQLENPAWLVSPHWNTPTLIGSEGFGQPSREPQTSYGHTECLNPSNEQRYGTIGAAMDASEQRLCFGMVSIK